MGAIVIRTGFATGDYDQPGFPSFEQALNPLEVLSIFPSENFKFWDNASVGHGCWIIIGKAAGL